MVLSLETILELLAMASPVVSRLLFHKESSSCHQTRTQQDQEQQKEVTFPKIKNKTLEGVTLICWNLLNQGRD